MLTESDSRRELGDFVRAQREKLTPAVAGLTVGTRRRTPGLRREEVAQLCGLSVTWYTWIEQGRDVSVSPTALARLATTLRLARAERAYLFGLAGKRDPDQHDSDAGDVPASLLACVSAIATPAYILDRTWTARGWNAPAQRLFVGWLDATQDRNLLRYIFLAPAARALICDWPERARRVVAEFRAACSAHLNDPALRAVIDGLRLQSPAFAGLWDQHGVVGREGGARTFSHPIDGFLRYEQVTFDLATQPDLKLTVLVDGPTDGPTATG
ncbi:helix-turn-helix transcriptional regulator [Reyranella sp. CPCC 100927]|uniref:helix-turn-helix transcriptional regulator n=1 Tax=Reyranella sp. CPCC 100927 TaxID=2599616 RepID=UPI0011B71D38|nr:helix-turn-helix transcriptional regulator [Reyranella sp. CPCC 100927]TWT15578.1 helix-turn-helix domain-containing protein [Reyranella sp. CPCC 100927]